MTTSEKAIAACAEYFHAWDTCQNLRAKVRAMRCELRDSETVACHADATMLEDDWCAQCIEGKRVIEEELKPAKRLVLSKLGILRRCGKRIVTTTECENCEKRVRDDQIRMTDDDVPLCPKCYEACANDTDCDQEEVKANG